MQVMVVMPALNAERTLEATLAELPRELHSRVLLVDDGSTDGTVALARRLGLDVLTHGETRGYGANQKTCYRAALERGAEVVVMLHPDHQYDARAVPRLVAPVEAGAAEVVLGSRLLKGRPLAQGMPLWRYVGNRLLTLAENRVLGCHLSEYHTGMRAYSADFLRRVSFEANSDGFVFDQQILVQAVAQGCRIAEVPVVCRYFPEASSISLAGSVLYGLGTLWTLEQYRRHCREPGSVPALLARGLKT